jgi:type VI secretion system secreted protein VgrG
MAEVIELATVAIQIQDVDKAIQFSNLTINQRLADTNSFAFIWRVEQDDVALSKHVEFYKNNLGKQVSVTIDDSFVFKGVIQNILCYNQFAHNTEYEVAGKGLLIKLDEIQQCKSFTKQTLKDIFQEIGGKTPMRLEPKKNDKLFYTVQYNQTNFEFLSMLAARHGEWFYYTGEQMVLGPPDKKAVELKMADGFVYDLNITARMQQQSNNITGFDHYKGEFITSTEEADKPGGSGMIDAAVEASKNFYGNGHAPVYYSHSVKKEILEQNSELNQQSAASSTVYISGRTHLSSLRLGGTIKLIDEKDNSAGEYIIIELYHSCSGKTNYQSHFVAIPSETQTPPYTNAHLFTFCKPLYGEVAENEDKDGLARVKVHFGWQKAGETSPWLNVIVPHAGDGRGFRFLPEKGDTVIVDFIDNNAERPFVMGAVFSEKHKPDVPHDGNNIKIIGTRSNRRLEIHDDKGEMSLKDFKGNEPGNSVRLVNNNAGTVIQIASGIDDKNFSQLNLKTNISLQLAIMKDGVASHQIKFSSEENKISIYSKGSINLHADGAINMSASEINMKAGGEMIISKKGIDLIGKEIDIDAEMNVGVNGQNEIEIAAGNKVSVSAVGQLDLSATGITKLEGAIVKIN